MHSDDVSGVHATGKKNLDIYIYKIIFILNMGLEITPQLSQQSCSLPNEQGRHP